MFGVWKHSGLSHLGRRRARELVECHSWFNIKIWCQRSNFNINISLRGINQSWSLVFPNTKYWNCDMMSSRASFSRLQTLSVVFGSTKLSIDFGVWKDSKSPDTGDGWFAVDLKWHEVWKYHCSCQVLDWSMRLWCPVRSIVCFPINIFWIKSTEIHHTDG